MASDTVSEQDLQVIQQVEYYFGDANLRKDKFMKQTLDENEGWMPLATLLKFNRLKRLSEDAAVIVSSLKKSTSGLLEIAEDDSKVRRSLSRPVPELTDSVKKETNVRTVYIKGFPTTFKLEDIESFLTTAGFSKGVISNIVLRRQLESRDFKGSVFVEFADVETTEKFLESKHKLADSEELLVTLSRNDYYKKKEDERKELRGKVRESAVAAAAEVAGQIEDEELKFEPECVLSFDKCGPETTRESLKELFGRFEDIQWVNFMKGETCGKIRFANAGGAKKALEAVQKESEDGTVKIDGVEATCHVLEGEAEIEYHKEVRRELASMKAKNRQNRSSNFRNTGRGRGRGFKRRGSGRGGEPRAKRSRDD